jgi:hypothetical protein
MGAFLRAQRLSASQRSAQLHRRLGILSSRDVLNAFLDFPTDGGRGVRVYPACSYSEGDMYPSDECRRTRLKKISMYSKMLALASSLVV